MIKLRPVVTRRAIALSPPRLLAIAFVTIMSLGATALLLPGMTRAPITVLQALFTATSATMVTGLAVVDTGSTFTFGGQLIIATLMQLGGIGTMAFAALALLVSGGRPPLRTHILVGEAIGQTRFRDLRRLIRLALSIAVIVEVVAAALLTLRFANDLPWAQALWAGVFHSVSSFNNAGFSLWPDSLTRYATDPLVNLVIPLEIIIGGLGFTVLADPGLLHGTRFRVRRRSETAPRTAMALHTKVTLLATAALLIGGTALFWLMEANNPRTLANHSAPGQLCIAWALSVMPRTAGFNTVDTAALTDSSTLLTLLLMFIGGGTGSTAGGVKVSTVLILLAATRAVLRQRAEPVLFGRQLTHDTVYRAFAILSVAGGTLLLATWLLMFTQRLPFIDVLFEAVSAFGTVGVSRGITAQLNVTGQLIIMALMFIGRVGPLTLAYTLATAQPSRVQYPSAEVYVG